MKMSNLSPRAEPVAWSVIVASALAALASYGFGVTDELKDFILLISPYILAGIAARFAVFAPDTVEEIANKHYEAGLPPVEPQPEIPSPPGGEEKADTVSDWKHVALDDSLDDRKGR